MLFNSLSFLVFFPIVVLIFFVMPKKARYIWLLVTSYFFYMCWNPTYVLLLILSTVATYAAGLLIGKWRDNTKYKKIVVAVCLLLNFGILFLFKYFDFFQDTMQDIFGKVHLSWPEAPWNFILPVGISFYIFQAVGYTIDVYRNTIEPEKNPFRYALFVSFFPQLVAGPIERSKNLLSQMQNIETMKLWNFERMQSGALVMLYGFFLKMVIADRAMIAVNTVFDVGGYSSYEGLTVCLGIALFSLQIYCDFAGYSYIAIGAARVMGFSLMDNFHTPYLANSVKDFWDRWHISLSTWFRDYLYFPLGGSRKGKVRKYINIMVIFIVSGLWHGAAWHFVVWGLLHGVARVLEELTSSLREKCCKFLKIRTNVTSFRLGKILLTFTFVSLAWTYFRAESVHQATAMIRQIFVRWNPWVLFDGSFMNLGLDAKDYNVLIVALLILFTVECFQYKKVKIAEFFAQQNLLFRALFFYLAIILLAVFGVYGAGYDAAQFIYFRF